MPECQKVLYEELRPFEFAERLTTCPIAYLPLGTLEWHGRHLPLGADGIQAREFFVELARRVGGIVLPMLFLGPDGGLSMEKDGKSLFGMDIVSFEDGSPQQLAGCAYRVEDQLYLAILEAILGNLSRAGFRIVVAQGHGPSTNLFFENIPRFEAGCGLRLFVVDNWATPDRYGFQADHAAFNETSLVMALRPELVEMDELYVDPVPVGVWGVDPRTEASEDAGRRIVDRHLDRMAELLTRVLAEVGPVRHETHYHHVKNLVKSPGEST